jgi:hypothetical protein
MTHRNATALVVGLLVFTAGAWADDKPQDKKQDPAKLLEQAALKQEQQRRQFDEWKAITLRLCQRLERGQAEQRKQAGVLQKVLSHARDLNLETKMAALTARLKTKGIATSVDGLAQAAAASDDLARDLGRLLAGVPEEGPDRTLSQRSRAVEAVGLQVEELLTKQRRVRELADRKTDADRIAKEQKQATEAARALLGKIEKEDLLPVALSASGKQCLKKVLAAQERASAAISKNDAAALAGALDEALRELTPLAEEFLVVRSRMRMRSLLIDLRLEQGRQTDLLQKVRKDLIEKLLKDLV